MMEIAAKIEDYTPAPKPNEFQPVIDAAKDLPAGRVVSFAIGNGDVNRAKRILRELAGKIDRTARIDAFENSPKPGETTLKVWLVGKISRPRADKTQSAESPEDVQTVETEPVTPAVKGRK